MTGTIHVAQPPAKSLLVFDADCNFCCFWIGRWRRITGPRIDYLPFQEPEVRMRFPEVPMAHFETSVQLIEPDGRVFSGAEAVFRSLASCPAWRWLLWVYTRVPGAAWLSEQCYQFVARNRSFFSALTRLIWGRRAASLDCRKETRNRLASPPGGGTPS